MTSEDPKSLLLQLDESQLVVSNHTCSTDDPIAFPAAIECRERFAPAADRESQGGRAQRRCDGGQVRWGRDRPWRAAQPAHPLSATTTSCGCGGGVAACGNGGCGGRRFPRSCPVSAAVSCSAAPATRPHGRHSHPLRTAARWRRNNRQAGRVLGEGLGAAV